MPHSYAHCKSRIAGKIPLKYRHDTRLPRDRDEIIRSRYVRLVYDLSCMYEKKKYAMIIIVVRNRIRVAYVNRKQPDCYTPLQTYDVFLVIGTVIVRGHGVVFVS